jgi:hypothetical protein
MELDESLKLERYKLVTDRQKYFTNLASGAFASYIKIFTGLVAGGIGLVSAKSKLGIEPELVVPLLKGIVCLVTFLGLVAIFQIIFCLVRWKEYREAEREVSAKSPPVKWWWWVFEGLYCVGVGASILTLWVICGKLCVIIGGLEV